MARAGTCGGSVFSLPLFQREERISPGPCWPLSMKLLLFFAVRCSPMIVNQGTNRAKNMKQSTEEALSVE